MIQSLSYPHNIKPAAYLPRVLTEENKFVLLDNGTVSVLIPLIDNALNYHNDKKSVYWCTCVFNLENAVFPERVCKDY